MAELTAVMKIGSPSLYAAFGGKEALFRDAVTMYAATAGSLTARVLTEEPTAREAIEAMLRGNSTDYLRPGLPPGAWQCSPGSTAPTRVSGRSWQIVAAMAGS